MTLTSNYKSVLKTSTSAAVIYTMATSFMGAASAQEVQSADDQGTFDEIIVTATRRAGTVQDVPINIAATSGAQIEEQGFKKISDVLAFVPGINVIDRGGRMGNRLIVRGLNADGLGQGNASSNGGTVATYLGEVPITIDLRLNDLERVETLLGPQGTLYGAGTLGGAIRYLPNKADFDGMMFEVRGDAYTMQESSGISSDVGFTINAPLSDTFALRGSLDYANDKGFIDYAHVVAEPGVSDPNAPLSDTANFSPVQDANGQESFSGRAALRWKPTDGFDANLTYYFQNNDNEGRPTSGRLGERKTERYVSPSRVLEPDEQRNQLLALEITADLGFAELTSATGVGKYTSTGQRDQTDLLISLEYSYESFPTFTALTREDEKNTFFNQEVRLVSTSESELSWIVGGYYNKFNTIGTSAEYTPGYAAFAGFDRPDDLEYFSSSTQELVEKAIFGEVAYQITDEWQVTVGGRYFEYELQTSSAVDFPLFDPDFTIPDFEGLSDRAFDPTAGQKDNGTLFKVNTSYKVSDDVLAYATVSQGYRIGNSNGQGPCAEFDPDKQQGACALAPGQKYGPNPEDVAIFDERAYGPDRTTNYEVGLKTTLLDGALTFNTALYYVKWQDPQLSSATVNASIPITINATGAESKGVELSSNWRVTDQLNIRGAFSYTKSKLTDDVPSLIRTITPPGFATAFEDGKDGDRLPGSPETQFSIFANYDQPLDNGNSLHYNFSYAVQGNVLSRTGARGNSRTLGGFGVANATVVYDAEAWSVTAYVNNLFNEYGETGVQSTRLSNQTILGHSVRSYQVTVLTPRTFGLRMTYRFE